MLKRNQWEIYFKSYRLWRNALEYCVYQCAYFYITSILPPLALTCTLLFSHHSLPADNSPIPKTLTSLPSCFHPPPLLYPRLSPNPSSPPSSLLLRSSIPREVPFFRTSFSLSPSLSFLLPFTHFSLAPLHPLLRHPFTTNYFPIFYELPPLPLSWLHFCLLPVPFPFSVTACLPTCLPGYLPPIFPSTLYCFSLLRLPQFLFPLCPLTKLCVAPPCPAPSHGGPVGPVPFPRGAAVPLRVNSVSGATPESIPTVYPPSWHRGRLAPSAAGPWLAPQEIHTPELPSNRPLPAGHGWPIPAINIAPWSPTFALPTHNNLHTIILTLQTMVH